MSLFNNLYGWLLPKQAEFLNHYKGNDQQFNMARQLWNSLDQSAVFFLAIFVVLGILISAYYYGPYNKRPGRHYKVSKWLLWLIVAAAACFVVTLGVGLLCAETKLAAKYGLVLRIAAENTIYAVGMYFIFSFIRCNIRTWKTNAYRFLKIGK